MADNPQRNDTPQPASSQRDQVSGVITLQAIWAGPSAARLHDAVSVEHEAIEHVEDIPRDDRTKGHEPPVHAQPVDTKCFGDDGGENSEQEAVAETGE